ncbi:hypothetical protein [Streptacidiphilus sp. PAMC 29251]
MSQLAQRAIDLLSQDVLGGYLATVGASLTLWAAHAVQAALRRRIRPEERSRPERITTEHASAEQPQNPDA